MRENSKDSEATLGICDISDKEKRWQGGAGSG